MTLQGRWSGSLEASLGLPEAAEFRHTPDDFRVDEYLDFRPEGSGEHLWLYLEKRNLTTLQLISLVAQACQLPNRAIGYSGMKDRNAVTRQWISLHLPGKDAPSALAEALGSKDVILLEQSRHPRKLKRGVHRHNCFRLRVNGQAVRDGSLAMRWQALCDQGVPNYFGAQRFGRGGQNLEQARRLLARGWRKRDDRHGVLLSTARSFLFNELLSARIEAGDWARPMEGDILMLDGTQSLFQAKQIDTDLLDRAARLDLHPTGVLWGTKTFPAGQHEAALAQRHPDWCAGLERSGVAASRRALRMRLVKAELTQHSADEAILDFCLPRGGFATAVLKELMVSDGLELGGVNR